MYFSFSNFYLVSECIQLLCCFSFLFSAYSVRTHNASSSPIHQPPAQPPAYPSSSPHPYLPNSLLLLYMQIQAGSFLYRKPIYIRRGDSQYMRVACVYVCVCRILIHTHAYRYTWCRPKQLLNSNMRVGVCDVCAGRLDARMTPLLLRFSHVWIFSGDM